LKIDIKKAESNNQNLSKNILNGLKKAVVVNVKDLEVLYKDLNLIITVLSKNAFYFNGRYILNNSFYPKDLQQTRTKILEILNKKGFILMTDIDQDTNLILELCIKDEKTPKYYLKGYYEEENSNILKKAVQGDSIVYDFIKEKYFCTLDDITKSCPLDSEQIKKILFNSEIISLGDNIYTVFDPEDPYNELKKEIIRLVQNKKSYRKGEMNTAISNISEVLNIENEVVISHIEKVFTNKKGIWVVKDSFL
jgi:uncharacterized protein YdcH (DUF465 family)